MDLFKPKHRLTVRNVRPVGGALPKVVKILGQLTKAKLASEMKKLLKGNGVHPKVLKGLHGMGVWSDLWSSIKNISSDALPHVIPTMTKVIKKKVHKGKTPTKHKVGKVQKVFKHVVDKRKSRALIVKEVMAKHGLPMIKASAYVKQHGLY